MERKEKRGETHNKRAKWGEDRQAKEKWMHSTHLGLEKR